MKAYNINLSEDNKFIRIQVWIPVTLNLALSFISDLTKLGTKLNLSSAVINIRNTKSISSISEKYSFAYEKAETAGLNRSWKIALIKEVKDNSPDFLETVMFNAGYQFKVFTDEPFASDWLKSKSKF